LKATSNATSSNRNRSLRVIHRLRPLSCLPKYPPTLWMIVGTSSRLCVENTCCSQGFNCLSALDGLHGILYTTACDDGGNCRRKRSVISNARTFCLLDLSTYVQWRTSKRDGNATFLGNSSSDPVNIPKHVPILEKPLLNLEPLELVLYIQTSK